MLKFPARAVGKNLSHMVIWWLWWGFGMVESHHQKHIQALEHNITYSKTSKYLDVYTFPLVQSNIQSKHTSIYKHKRKHTYTYIYIHLLNTYTNMYYIHKCILLCLRHNMFIYIYMQVFLQTYLRQSVNSNKVCLVGNFNPSEKYWSN